MNNYIFKNELVFVMTVMSHNSIRTVFLCIFSVSLLLSSGCVQTQTDVPLGTDEMTDRSLFEVQESGKLVVGTNLPYPPIISYDDSGEIVGFDVDLIKEIAKDMNLDVEIINFPWEGIFDRLDTGEIDVIINAITITPERSEKYLFSAPYLNAGQTIVTRTEIADIENPDDLRGRNVSVLEDTTSEDAALEYNDREFVFGYADHALATQSLLNGETEAMIVDLVVGVNTANDNPSLKLIEGSLTEEYYGIVAKKGNDALMDEINDVLRHIKTDGRHTEMMKKWLT